MLKGQRNIECSVFLTKSEQSMQNHLFSCWLIIYWNGTIYILRLLQRFYLFVDVSFACIRFARQIIYWSAFAFQKKCITLNERNLYLPGQLYGKFRWDFDSKFIILIEGYASSKEINTMIDLNWFNFIDFITEMQIAKKKMLNKTLNWWIFKPYVIGRPAGEWCALYFFAVQ